MAAQASPNRHTDRARITPSPAAKLSLAAAVIAIVNKMGLNNVMASAAVALAAPAAATVFVHEIAVLRSAQLQHEATDRRQFLRVATEGGASPTKLDEAPVVAAPPRLDLGAKLDGMIVSRSRLLDLFGDEPSAVAPIYARIIRQMLRDDTQALALLADPAEAGPYDDDLVAKAARLRAVHARLEHLVGA